MTRLFSLVDLSCRGRGPWVRALGFDACVAVEALRCALGLCGCSGRHTEAHFRCPQAGVRHESLSSISAQS